MPRSARSLAQLRVLLRRLQRDVERIEQERGTSHETAAEKTLILAEESFEVLKALRYRAGIATTSGHGTDLGAELVDVLFASAAIANRVPCALSDAVSLLEVCPPNGQLPVGTVARSASLDLGLTLAAEVLNVVQLARALNAAQRGPIPPDTAATLKESLGLVATVADEVAHQSGVDLDGALRSKLNRDQLRLWTTPDELRD